MKPSKTYIILIIPLILVIYLLLNRAGFKTDLYANGNSNSSVPLLVPASKTYVNGSHQISDFYISSDEAIWAVGYDGQDSRRLFLSKNKGQSWERISVDSSGYIFNSISFLDKDFGFITGNNGTYLRTLDGGRFWKEVRLEMDVDFTTADFLSPSFGFIGGKIKRPNNSENREPLGVKILYTEDGGNSWKPCYEDQESTSLFNIKVLNSGAIVVVTPEKGILKSDDKAKTWKNVLSREARITSIRFITDQVAFALSDTGEIIKSTDQGSTWHKISTIGSPSTDSFWWDLDFFDEKKGIVVGDKGTYAFTIDGGITWKSTTLDKPDNLSRVRVKKKLGLVIGLSNIYQIHDFNN